MYSSYFDEGLEDRISELIEQHVKRDINTVIEAYKKTGQNHEKKTRNTNYKIR